MEFFDWRLLLFVVVFGTGWVIARFDMDQVVSRARGVPEWVMTGIAKLLTGQRAEAAKDFLKAAQPLGRENAELHFAAGELYRIQGDHESAIRVHKAMINADLDEKQVARARFELGLDYQKGGFLDLAEQCFRQLQGTEHNEASLRHLLNIHMYSKAWDKAVEDEERFSSDDSSAELRRHVIAQLYCEWANSSTSDKRAELIDKALSHNPDCGRAWLLRAETTLQDGDFDKAISYLDNLKRIPQIFPVAAKLIMKAYAKANRADEGVIMLVQAFEREPSALLFEKTYEVIVEEQGVEAMGSYIKQALQSVGGPVVVAKWFEYERSVNDNKEIFDAPLRALGDTRAKFHCQRCDFKAHNHYWQCPVCLEWETLLPNSKQKVN